MLYKLAESLGNRGTPDEHPEKSPLNVALGDFFVHRFVVPKVRVKLTPGYPTGF